MRMFKAKTFPPTHTIAHLNNNFTYSFFVQDSNPLLPRQRIAGGDVFYGYTDVVNYRVAMQLKKLEYNHLKWYLCSR